MTLPILIVLCVMLAALVLFSTDAFPVEVSSLLVVAALALSGVLSPEQAFRGFSNEIVIFIFTLLAMTQGLASTGVIHLISQRLSFFSRFGHTPFLLGMMVLVTATSSILSNTVVTAAFLPVAIGAAHRANVAVSKVLMPLAFSSMLGGTILLLGTSTNLVVSAEMELMGLAPIGFAELAPIGLPIAGIGITLILLLSPFLLPSHKDLGASESGSLRNYLTEAVLPEGSPYLNKPLSAISTGLALTIVGVVRDGVALSARPDHILTRRDRLLIDGAREDILRVKDTKGIDLKSDRDYAMKEDPGSELVLVEASVAPGSPLVDRTLRDVLFSKRYGLIVLAVHRRPALQRFSGLQLFGRLFGGDSLSQVPIAIGDVLLLQGPRGRLEDLADGSELLVLTDIDYQPPRYPKAGVALGIFVAVLALAIFKVLTFAVAGLCGLLAMLVTRCVDSRTAFRIDWRVVLLIASMMALGTAMEVSGAGEFLGGHVAGLGEVAGPRGVLLTLMLLTIFLSAPMSNQAAALVLLPVALGSAEILGVDPRPFAIGVCLAASCSFVTPLEPSCLLVYGPGRYRFADYVRLGAPITVAIVILLTVGIPLLWKF